MKKTILLCFITLQAACASIVNDANIPMTVSFSDGSAGKCVFRNKRGAWPSAIPNTLMIRRSDDALIYDCESEDGRDSDGSIVSEMEGAKLTASVIFFDLGITDAITDKHRTYQGNVVIPLAPKRPIVEKADQTTAINKSDKAPDMTRPVTETHSETVPNKTKLKELKQLYDDGLVSEAVYLDKQREILLK